LGSGLRPPADGSCGCALDRPPDPFAALPLPSRDAAGTAASRLERMR
jgi:hypothetical protein